HERAIDCGDVELSVLEAGVGGRPLLLVHGFTGCKEDFADEVDRLAVRGFWVVAPDHRGHGASSQPEDESAYSLDAYAGDVWALCRANEWDGLSVIGHSMGGMVVQLMVVEQPGRFE